MLLPMRPEEGTHLDKVYQVVSAVTSSFQVVRSDELLFIGKLAEPPSRVLCSVFFRDRVLVIWEKSLCRIKNKCSAGDNAGIVSTEVSPHSSPI